MAEATKERIVRHFDDTVRHWTSLYDTTAGWTTYNDKIYRFNYVAGMVPPGPGCALDVGAGAGQFLICLNRLGYTATGLEISHPMASEAATRLRRRSAGRHHAGVIIGDCEHIPCPDESFDLYTAMGVIEYQDSDEPMIRECRRVLKPGGIGIITARNRSCPAVRWKCFYEDHARHAAARLIAPLRNSRMPKPRVPISREHSPGELKRSLREHGFQILDQRFCHFYVLPHPIGRYLRPIEFFMAKHLEILSRTPLGFLGSTYIVKFQKIR